MSPSDSQSRAFNSHSSPSNPTDRVRSIANQMSNPVLTTSFPAESVPQAPEDPLFGLAAAYRADTSPDKIDLVGLPFSLLIHDVARSNADNRRDRELVPTVMTMQSLGFCQW